MKSRGLKHVSRCPLCGAWSWQNVCATPHQPRKVRVYDDSPVDLGGRWVKHRGIKVWRPAA